MSFQGQNHFQGVFKDLAVFQGVFQARANHDVNTFHCPPEFNFKFLLTLLNESATRGIMNVIECT